MAPTFRVIEGGHECSTGRKPLVWNRTFGPQGGALVLLDDETDRRRTTLAVDDGQVLVGIRTVGRSATNYEAVVSAWVAWARSEGRAVRDERAPAEAMSKAVLACEIEAVEARRAARRGCAPPAADGLFGGG